MSINSSRVALLLAALAGCSDLSTAADRTPTTLQLDQDTVTIVAGSMVPVKVVVLDQNGVPFDRLPGWVQPTWTTTDAGVVRAEGGEVRAVSPGQASLVVQVGDLSARAVVRVNPERLQLRVVGAYLTQSVQRFDGSIPLVQGRDALLRVFLTGDQPSFFTPSVRAILHKDGAVLRSFEVRSEGASIPLEASEKVFASSWNVVIPGALLTPGVSLSVEADPEASVPRSAGSVLRLPAAGTLPLSVQPAPKLWLRMIPVHQALSGTTGRISAANLGSYLEPLVGKFPIAEVDADVRTTYSTNADLTTTTGWSQLLREVEALRDVDGSARYYYGVHTNPRDVRYLGLGYVGWPASIGHDELPGAGETFAHELGHNFGLPHAPCGRPSGVDPQFPYSDGSIGVFGYDILSGRAKDPASQKDLMTYCGPEWISDYNYLKVMGFRQRYDWTESGPDRSGAREPALLVWGGVRDGRPVLEPSFVVDTRPDLPEGAGTHRIEGYDAGGARLFSYAFTPRVMDHESADRGFSFAIPARVAQPARLARLELAGPEGRARRVRASAVTPGRPEVATRRRGGRLAVSWQSSAHPMALVRDARTGEVLSFARGGRVDFASIGREVEILLSDGVSTVRPSVEAR